MGCCFSNNKGFPRKNELHSQVGLESLDQSKAPPSSTEEETVKEVLSETPKPKKAHIFTPQQEDDSNKTQNEKPTTIVKKIQEKESLNKFNIKTEPKSYVTEDYSASEEVSEICSASLSESLSTVTVRDEEEDDEVRQQKQVFRSGSRNRVVGRSPNRKLDQSPNKRNGGSMSYSSGKLVQQRGLRPDPTRKDPGESSGRRSRSPAVMGRNQSGKRTNHSPSRVRGEQQQQQQEQHGITKTAMEGKWPSCNNNNNNESLENPLVSLECFIFL